MRYPEGKSKGVPRFYLASRNTCVARTWSIFGTTLTIWMLSASCTNGRMLNGTYSGWSRTNLAALRASGHRLTPENRALLEDFAALQGALPKRIAAMRRGGFFRQGRVSQLALWLAVLMGRS